MRDRIETGEYLMAMAGELAVLAKEKDFQLAAKLIEMAHLSLAQDLGITEEGGLADSA